MRYLFLKVIDIMNLSDGYIGQIIRESIDKVLAEQDGDVDAVDFFNGINRQHGNLTAWNPETKMERMNPGHAARVNGGARFSKGKEPRYHSIKDWQDNYPHLKWKEYCDLDLDGE